MKWTFIGATVVEGAGTANAVQHADTLVGDYIVFAGATCAQYDAWLNPQTPGSDPTWALRLKSETIPTGNNWNLVAWWGQTDQAEDYVWNLPKLNDGGYKVVTLTYRCSEILASDLREGSIEEVAPGEHVHARPELHVCAWVTGSGTSPSVPGPMTLLASGTADEGGGDLWVADETCMGMLIPDRILDDPGTPNAALSLSFYWVGANEGWSVVWGSNV